MAYSINRIWYGYEGYEWAWYYESPTAGTRPCIIYCPGGGWVGAAKEAWEDEIIWKYGLNDGTSSYQEDYDVFVVSTASFGYNQRKVLQAAGTLIDSWANATAYAIGDEIYHAGRTWTPRTAHTSATATNEPGSGSSWESYWREYGHNEAGFWQVDDFPETTPGFLDESIHNLRYFVAWLRRKISDGVYDIDPDKLILAGASAGGQRAGCAAYMYGLPYEWEGSQFASHPAAIHDDGQPNGLYLNITPVDFTKHLAPSLAGTGLWGKHFSSSDWSNLSDIDKKAMSSVHILADTKKSVPTFMMFPATQIGDYREPDIWNIDMYHHAENGNILLKQLTDTVANGGLAQNDGQHLFLQASAKRWRTGEAYVVDDVVYVDYTTYTCILGHTSASADKPGTGANQATYWSGTTGTRGVEYKTDYNAPSYTPFTTGSNADYEAANCFFEWAIARGLS